MATIDDGLLRGPPAPDANPASTGWFVHRLMALAQEELSSTGDRCQRVQNYSRHFKPGTGWWTLCQGPVSDSLIFLQLPEELLPAFPGELGHSHF